MKIEHIAIWVSDLEKSRRFYCNFFKGQASEKYHNQSTGFKSYFINFDEGARLEIMTRPDVNLIKQNIPLGYVHSAFSVGSKEAVDGLTEYLIGQGVEVISAPRTTGDGYYESVVLDPDGNEIEITI